MTHVTCSLTRAYSKDFSIIHTSMVSAGARAYNRGLGAEPPAEVQGQSPRWGSGAQSPPKVDEVFVFKTLIFNASATVLHQMMQTIVRVAYGFTVRICSLAIAEQHACNDKCVGCAKGCPVGSGEKRTSPFLSFFPPLATSSSPRFP